MHGINMKFMFFSMNFFFFFFSLLFRFFLPLSHNIENAIFLPMPKLFLLSLFLSLSLPSPPPPMPVVLGLIFFSLSLFPPSFASYPTYLTHAHLRQLHSIYVCAFTELWSVKNFIHDDVMVAKKKKKKTQYLGGWWQKHFRFNFHFFFVELNWVELNCWEQIIWLRNWEREREKEYEGRRSGSDNNSRENLLHAI